MLPILLAVAGYDFRAITSDDTKETELRSALINLGASMDEQSQPDEEPKRKRGRPPKPIPMIDASPEEVARAMFAAAKPPDPSLRKFNQRVKPSSASDRVG